MTEVAMQENDKSQKRYMEMVKYFSDREKNDQLNTAKFRYELGKFLNELVDVPDKYGSKTIAQFSQDTKIGVSTLESSRKLASSWTEEDLNEMMGYGLTWTSLVYLGRLSKADRDKVLRTLHSGKFSDDNGVIQNKEVVKACKAYISEGRMTGKRDKRGQASPLVVIRSCGSVLSNVRSSVVGLLDAAKAISEIEKAEKKKAAEDKFKDTLKELSGAAVAIIDTVLELNPADAEKILKRVQDKQKKKAGKAAATSGEEASKLSPAEAAV